MASNRPDSFEFGHNESLQGNLFDAAEVSMVKQPEESQPIVAHQLEEGGSIPTQPLQFLPKQLRIEPIEHVTARRIWLDEHYLHRDYAGATLELGVFSPNMQKLVGAIGFSVRLGGSVEGGTPHIWEIRRMWLSDVYCAKNSESRVLAVACKIVKRLAPQVRKIISYSDHTHMKHKGTIYKAAGFQFDGKTNLSGSASWTTHASHKVADSHSKKRWVKTL